MKYNHYATGYSGLTGADVAAYLKRTFTTEENKQAEDMIVMFEAQLCSLCNRQFSPSVTYEEKFMLPARKVFTHNFPIAELASVTVDGTALSLTEDEDYIIWDTYLEFTPTLYGNKTLKLEYTVEKFWGDEVKLLLLQLVGQAWLSAESGMSVSEIGFSAVRQVFALDKFERDTKRVINMYRKRVL